jgi:hypothetical protein
MFTVILNTIVGYPIPVVQGKPFLQGNMGIYASADTRAKNALLLLAMAQDPSSIWCHGCNSNTTPPFMKVVFT